MRLGDVLGSATRGYANAPDSTKASVDKVKREKNLDKVFKLELARLRFFILRVFSFCACTDFIR